MILGVTLYITNTKVNKKNLFSFIITLAVMFLIQDYIAARAQLVTFIFFVLEILFIESFLETKKKRYAIGLVALAILIANMHAAVFYFFFILMMPYIGEYLIIVLRNSNLIYKYRINKLKRKINNLSSKPEKEEKLAKLQEKLLKVEEKFIKYKEFLKNREENPYRIKLVKRDAVKWLIVIMLICFAAGLLTPIGDEPYTHIFKLMSGNTTDSISEHQPLVLSEHKEETTIIILLIILLVFTDTKISLKDAFMIGGLFTLTFMSRRQFTMLALIGGISFTKLIADFTEKYDKNGIEDFTKLVVKWQGKALTLLLVVLSSFVLFMDKPGAEYIDESSYPIKAVDFLLEEADNGRINLETMKMYNDYNYGSYLLYRGIPVFIDSRADLYSPEFNEGIDIFSDFLNISGLGVWYDDKFDEYGITHVMTYSNSKLNMLLTRDENYNQLYKDDHFVVYERLNVNSSDGE